MEVFIIKWLHLEVCTGIEKGIHVLWLPYECFFQNNVSFQKYHKFMKFQFSSVQLLSRVRLFATPWIAARQASLSITNSWSSPKLMSLESVMPSNHLILCFPLLLLPSIFPSIRVFSESALCIRQPKEQSLSISSCNECSGLNSFRINWFVLLAVQGTLKEFSPAQFNSFMLNLHGSTLTFLYDTGKTIALTIWIFIGTVMSLLFVMLSGFVIVFLPRSKHLVIL